MAKNGFNLEDIIQLAGAMNNKEEEEKETQFDMSDVLGLVGNNTKKADKNDGIITPELLTSLLPFIAKIVKEADLDEELIKLLGGEKKKTTKKKTTTKKTTTKKTTAKKTTAKKTTAKKTTAKKTSTKKTTKKSK